MGLDGQKDVHLDGSSVGSVSRLEVLEGPSGRRVRSEAERARIVAESLQPGAQVSEVARKHGATRWQIYDWHCGLNGRSKFDRDRSAKIERRSRVHTISMPLLHQGSLRSK
jgi:transposase